jgi:hypothetical protein
LATLAVHKRSKWCTKKVLIGVLNAAKVGRSFERKSPPLRQVTARNTFPPAFLQLKESDLPRLSSGGIMKKTRDKRAANMLVGDALLSSAPLSRIAFIAKRIVSILWQGKGETMSYDGERHFRMAPPDGCGRGTARGYDQNTVSPEQLRALVTKLSEEEDEEDRPSSYSTRVFEQLMTETWNRLGGKIGRPVVVPDSEQGIWIAWKNSDREVRVVLPKSEKQRAYIFFRKGSHSELDEVSADVLAERLQAIA